jgi:hypothetical protein
MAAQNMRSVFCMSENTARRRAKSAPRDELRKSDVMARLLDALDDGKDVGHYGRLVFAMVGRHFMDEKSLIDLLAKDRDFPEDEARSLVRQVIERDYNPPRRDRILEWQSQQAFQMIETPDDPDSGNLYRDLTFPDGVYDDISEYHEQKAEASA